jgi:hypothetical protein
MRPKATPFTSLRRPSTLYISLSSFDPADEFAFVPLEKRLLATVVKSF